MRAIQFSLILLFSSLGLSSAFAAPLTFMYEGRLSNNGVGIETGAGTFLLNVKIKSPPPSGCTLWEETHLVSTPVGSSGRFRVEVGTGTKLSGIANLADVFDNSKTSSSLTCDTGAVYAPAGNLDKRSVVASVTYQSNTYTFAAVDVSSSPFAQFANSAGTVDVSGVNSGIGKYFGYMPNGTACAANQVLKWNGSVWDCAADATGGAPGDASYAAKGIVQFDTSAATSGINVTAGVARLANSGVTAGTYTKVMVDAFGRVTAGSSIVATDLPNTGVAANTYGSAVSVGSFAVDSQGRLTSAASIPISLDANAISAGVLSVARGGTGASSLAANRMVMTNVTGLALTVDSCSANQVLQYNGTAWACVAAASLGAANAVVNNGNSFASAMTIGTNDVNDLRLKTNGMDRFTVNAAGNVGIGTTTPNVLLEVGTSVTPTNSVASFQGSIKATNSDAGIVYPVKSHNFYNTVSAASGIGFITGSLATPKAAVIGRAEDVSGGIEKGSIEFQTLVNGGTLQTQMKIWPSGNVRIGNLVAESVNTKLDVAGQIRSPSFSTTTSAISWASGNSITTSFDCSAPINFSNLRDGGSYVLVVTSTSNTMCTFSTSSTGDDAGTLTYRFSPTNAARTLSSHTVYRLQRIGSVVYVDWKSY